MLQGAEARRAPAAPSRSKWKGATDARSLTRSPLTAHQRRYNTCTDRRHPLAEYPPATAAHLSPRNEALLRLNRLPRSVILKQEGESQNKTKQEVHGTRGRHTRLEIKTAGQAFVRVLAHAVVNGRLA